MTNPAQSLLHSLAQAFDMTLVEGETSLTFRKSYGEGCEYGLVVRISGIDHVCADFELKDSEANNRITYCFGMKSVTADIEDWLPEPRPEYGDSLVPAKPRYH